TLISSDPEIMPDALACLAASSALAVTDIPIQEIISEVRVSKINGEIKVNPTRSELENAEFDFIIAATEKNIMMVEGESKECSEDDVILAIETAHEAIKIQVKAQEELAAKCGITSKRDYTKPYRNEELNEKIKSFSNDKVYAVAKSNLPKHERSDALKAIEAELKTFLGEELPDEDKALIHYYFHDVEYHVIRNMMLDDQVRLDGRKYDQVRPLEMEVDYLASPHGSALFTRGETQSLTTVTLGTPDDEKMNETAETKEMSNFYLHYNFPGFSTGEVRPNRGVGRREVGHGNLAQRSLKSIFPAKNEFPYTTRIVSDILESNGSSSMATVCAGSLALMDAGAPLKKHVSGVAMGLISREDGKWCVLTDILGDEDHLGDMDFKVTGTRDGICAIQMDIKVDGLSMDVMRQALEQAKKGRLHILEAMYACIDAPRAEMKPQTPRMVSIEIDREFIGAIIGPGGKIIQEMQRETGTNINIEEVGDKGVVSIYAKEKESCDAALAKIKGIVSVPEIGEEYEAVVKSIMPYGAFMEFLPGKQGLLHISEVSWERLENLDGILKEGDSVKVKLLEVDKKTGKFKLSRKVLLPKEEKAS
nr:polyribonucleotide nucleotidyltransferase [Chitinophagaceae bacterium]